MSVEEEKNTQAEGSGAKSTTTTTVAPTPIVVEVTQPGKTSEELGLEAQERIDRAARERETSATNQRLVWIGMLQLVVFVLQLLVFGYQAYKLEQTVSAADAQSSDMKESIAQATRAAAAMEKVAANVSLSAKAATDSVAVLKDRTALQMRAYLLVSAGSAIYQEREKRFRFEARPLLLNEGSTPANEVRYAAKAAILPVPLATDFVLPPVSPTTGGSNLGPHQSSIVSGILDDYVADKDVAAIKRGQGRALYIWGVVIYKDVFGQEHQTEFCQLVLWLPNGQVSSFYITGRNSAD